MMAIINIIIIIVVVFYISFIKISKLTICRLLFSREKESETKSSFDLITNEWLNLKRKKEEEEEKKITRGIKIIN
jgi:hypothetical protein